MSVLIKLLHEDAMTPTRATQYSAGLDLFAVEEIIIQPGDIGQIKTGIAMELPEGSYGRIADRSSYALKNLHVVGGVLDESFRGEIIVLLRNFSPDPYKVKKHEKMAQIIVTKIFYSKIEVVAELSSTDRGEQGFGSSGGGTYTDYFEKPITAEERSHLDSNVNYIADYMAPGMFFAPFWGPYPEQIPSEVMTQREEEIEIPFTLFWGPYPEQIPSEVMTQREEEMEIPLIELLDGGGDMEIDQ